MSYAGLSGGAGGGGGGMAIGGAVTGGTSKRVLYIGPTGLLAQNSNFLFDQTSNREELFLGPYDLNVAYTRAQMSWGYTGTVSFAPNAPTSPSGIINTGAGNGNWSVTAYYKIYSYRIINGQRLYSNTSISVTLNYTTTDYGTITWTNASGVDGYRIWISFDGTNYGLATDATTPFDDSTDTVWDSDDIGADPPPLPSWEHKYTYYPALGGSNMYSVYGGSGYFYNVGVNVAPQYKLHIKEDSVSTTAVRIVRDGSTSLNDAAFLVTDTTHFASAGATIENGGPNAFGVLRMAGTRVSEDDYLGAFEFQDRSAGGDKRTSMIIGKAGPGSATGKMEFLTRNGSGFQSALFIDEDGLIGIKGVTAPTAYLHIADSDGTYPPLKLTSGIDVTETDGAVEYDGSRLAFTIGTTRKRVALTNDVTPSNGQIPIGNGTDFTTASLTAGTNITITPGAGTITIAASGGGGGGGNSVTATLAFGASFTDKAQTVVTGQTWVTSGSEIVAQVLTPSGTDPDEMRLLDLKPVISDLVAGTGFTVTLYSEPEAKGDYSVMCIGV